MSDEPPPAALACPRRSVARPIAAILALMACGEGSVVPTTPRDATVATVDISPSVLLFTRLDSTVTLTAIGRDAASNIVTGLSFQWASGDAAVASVGASTGVVSAVTAGTSDEPVTVTATVGTVTGTGTVWVLPPEHTALDVNDAGEAAGFVERYELTPSGALTSTRAALAWAAGGAVTEIPSLGGEGSEAVGVSAGNEVAGTGKIATGADHAFLWTTGVPSDLGTAGAASSAAVDINDMTETLGTYRTTAQDVHAVVWAADGTPSEITELAGPSFVPAALSFGGHVAGTVTIAGGARRAFVWTDQGGVDTLATLGGSSSADDVNRFGAVVGSTYLPPDTTGPRGFYWSSQSGMLPIDALPGGDESHATAINRFDQVTGYGETAAGPRAFLWTQQGGLQDLGTLGGCCSRGYGINDQGDVVGASRTATGELRAFRYTAGTMSALGAVPR